MHTPKLRRIGCVAAAWLLTISLLAGCSSGSTPPGSQEAPGTGLAVGDKAPAFNVTDIATNKQLTLADLKGQVVLLNFWATWCQPCKQEMPDLQAFQQENKGKVQVVAVGLDDQETPEKMGAYAKQLGLTFTIGYDAGKASNKYSIIGIPTSYFIDGNGIIRGKHQGIMSPAVMRDLLATASR